MISEQQIIERLDHFGHLRHPFGRDQAEPVADVNKLGADSPLVRNAVQSYQAMHAVTLEQIIARNNPQLSSPAAHITGELDTDTVDLLQTARCWTPDYDPNVAMAVGAGNWPRCHGVGDFHCVLTKIITPIPDHIAPMFEDIWADVVESYRRVGLLVKRDQKVADTAANIQISFVTPPRGDGWIGLAIVGQGQKCSSRIWAQFDKNYRPANLRREWTTLIKHELGHNCGMGHSNGGVMNPYIIAGLPIPWDNDPSYKLLASRFGGKPVPVTGGKRQFDLVIAKRFDDDGSYQTISEIKSNLTDLPDGFWGQ